MTYPLHQAYSLLTTSRELNPSEGLIDPGQERFLNRKTCPATRSLQYNAESTLSANQGSSWIGISRGSACRSRSNDSLRVGRDLLVRYLYVLFLTVHGMANEIKYERRNGPLPLRRTLMNTWSPLFTSRVRR